MAVFPTSRHVGAHLDPEELTWPFRGRVRYSYLPRVPESVPASSRQRHPPYQRNRLRSLLQFGPLRNCPADESDLSAGVPAEVGSGDAGASECSQFLRVTVWFSRFSTNRDTGEFAYDSG